MPKKILEVTATQKADLSGPSFTALSETPGILIAHAPPDAVVRDRCMVSGKLVCGRSETCELPLFDARVSGRHFSIRPRDGAMVLEDLGSTNGTFVGGDRVVGPRKLTGPAVIRCGESVLVYHPNIGPLLKPSPLLRYGMAGRFHLDGILSHLKEAGISSNHLLIAGPSGTGKELAARAFARMAAPQEADSRLSIYNAAQFASREEAVAALFGVSARVFSNVDARVGLIEQADGGTLFLDELHNLSTDLQRALLRVIEDGEVTRLGENRPRRVNVRFVIASNAPGDTRGLADDLFARLRLVELPPLRDRVADIPTIFQSLLKRAMELRGRSSDEILTHLSGDHFESLCLADYDAGNIRILRDLTDRLVTRSVVEGDPAEAAAAVFGEHFYSSPVVLRAASEGQETPTSRYLQYKSLIVETFRQCNRNVAATERALKATGFSCSRRWLAVFLEDWGEKDG